MSVGHLLHHAVEQDPPAPERLQHRQSEPGRPKRVLRRAVHVGVDFVREDVRLASRLIRSTISGIIVSFYCTSKLRRVVHYFQ